MANTYTLIASNTLSSAAASVTFSAIPGTYTDLVLRFSVRGSFSDLQANMFVRFNNESASNYSFQMLVGTGSSALSLSNANQTYILGLANGATSTSSTFSNGEFYIPSYNASQNKPVSVSQVYENNATAARIHANAALWRNTAAISRIDLVAESGTLDSGSSFFLYGIKNS